MDSASRKLELGRPPEAGAISIERLVRQTLDGQFRIPHFQRGLKWRADNVLALFDSLRKGLPVGSLLFWKKKAHADTIHVGPLLLQVPDRPDARWVVDGQQRLVALTASLARALPLPRYPEDPYVVYFDPVEETFRAPSGDGNIPDQWVPLPYLLNATELSEFVHDWALGAQKSHRTVLFEAGARIREYQVPVYTVETEEEGVLKEIFYRINKSGRPLEWHDVHDALYVQEHDGQPTTLGSLASHLTGLGFGSFEPRVLTPVLLGMKGLDVTRALGDHLDKDRSVLEGAVNDGLPVLTKVVAFLRRARIPHLRFLPRMFVLESLARFFYLHPEPAERSMILMTRWLWRVLQGLGGSDERTYRRYAVNLVGTDEHKSVQALLVQALDLKRKMLDLGGTFDARSARSRLTLLGLSLMCPRDLTDGKPVDLVAVAEELGRESLPRFIRNDRHNSAVLLHPRKSQLDQLIFQRMNDLRGDDNQSLLDSHGITSLCCKAYQTDDYPRALTLRHLEIARRIRDMALWDAPDRDRPPISYLTSLDEGEL